jgi:WD40 repeat protein
MPPTRISPTSLGNGAAPTSLTNGGNGAAPADEHKELYDDDESSDDDDDSFMQVLVPPWVHNTQHSALYTLDVHCDGARFATAGLSGCVKVWAVQPLLAHASEVRASQPRLLWQSPAAVAEPVNVVKFSPNGRYLAYAGDGNGGNNVPITLLELVSSKARPAAAREYSSTSSQSSQSSQGASSSASKEVRHVAPSQLSGALSSETAHAETWRRVRTFNGHTSDIQDVAWAPDSNRLASCSVDNTVRVWNTDDAGGDGAAALIATLNPKLGLVQGVAWDPLGKYIGTFCNCCHVTPLRVA